MLGLGETPLSTLLTQFERAERAGFESVWVPNIFNYDALTLLALAGQVTKTITLGTAVVPTYPRHPTTMAQQVLSVQAATANRLVLGIGLSHKFVIEQFMGLDYSRPIRHMREYVSVLTQLLTGQPTHFVGETYRVEMQITVPNATPPPVLLAALGPQMLKIAGSLAGGTITWMGGPSYLKNTVVPIITEAGRNASGSARIVAGFPIAMTPKPDAARAAASRVFAGYAAIPSYRAVLDIEGAVDAADIALVGTEVDIEDQLDQLAAIGVTDLFGVLYDFQEDLEVGDRTFQFLASLAKSGKYA